MKAFFMVFLMALVSWAHGATLTCDPYPAQTDPSQAVASFQLYFDGSGSPVTTPAVVNSDGTQALSYNLSGLAPGNHTATATATNQAGAVSPQSSQLAFTLASPTPTPTPNPNQVYVDPNYSAPGYQNVSGTYTLTNGSTPSNATVSLNGSGTVNARVSWPAPGINQWYTVTANGLVLNSNQWAPWQGNTVVILSWPFTSTATNFSAFNGPAPTPTPPPQPVYVNPSYSDPGATTEVSGSYTLTNGQLPSSATIQANVPGPVKARVSWPAPGITQWNTVTANGSVVPEGMGWVPWNGNTVVILSWPFTNTPVTFNVQ